MPRMSRLFALPLVVLLALFASLVPAKESSAIFHLAVIDEVMSGFVGDTDVQFVEVRMQAPGQHLVNDTRLTVFTADGSSFSVLLLVPTDVPNDGTDVRWLMGTQAFADLSGLTPDFIFPPGIITPSGMVCWGAPDFAPPSGSWDPALSFNYTDCVAYGDYTGGDAQHAPPTDLPPGDGVRSLQRIQDPSVGGDLADFALAANSPENNAGETVTLEPSVGGVARVPDVADAPLAAQETSSGLSALFLAGVSAAALAAALILGRLLWRAMAGAGQP